MIIPMTLDGKPFEGMALVFLAMQITSLWIELRGTMNGGLIGSFWSFLISSIPCVLLGMQKIAELKTYLLVYIVLSAITFLLSIVVQDTTAAFRAAIGLGTSIAAYFLIDTQYDTAVWVLFASGLFSLMYAYFVVGPAKSLAQFERIVESGKSIERGGQERQLNLIRKEKEVLNASLKEGEEDLKARAKTMSRDDFIAQLTKLYTDDNEKRRLLVAKLEKIDVNSSYEK